MSERLEKADSVIDTTFIGELASKAPTPGGGGACAYCGALASALASMVGNLTVGKKKYAAVEDQMVEALGHLEVCRGRLIELIDKDAEAFAPLAAAYRMPNGSTDEQRVKNAAMQDALGAACLIPLAIMEECATIIDVCVFMAENGSRLAVSDAGVAVLFAKAALQGASLNILINLGSMDDAEMADSYRDKTESLLKVYGAKADDAFAFVMAEVG